MAYKKRGVPKGYIHNWKYQGHWKEKKNKDGSWNIDFRATKGKRAKGYGNFKKGFKIHWKIIADQYATKIGKGRYQTRLIGKKFRVHSGYGKRFRKDHNKLRRRY